MCPAGDSRPEPETRRSERRGRVRVERDAVRDVPTRRYTVDVSADGVAAGGVHRIRHAQPGRVAGLYPGESLPAAGNGRARARAYIIGV